TLAPDRGPITRHFASRAACWGAPSAMRWGIRSSFVSSGRLPRRVAGSGPATSPLPPRQRRGPGGRDGGGQVEERLGDVGAAGELADLEDVIAAETGRAAQGPGLGLL